MVISSGDKLTLSDPDQWKQADAERSRTMKTGIEEWRHWSPLSGLGQWRQPDVRSIRQWPSARPYCAVANCGSPLQCSQLRPSEGIPNLEASALALVQGNSYRLAASLENLLCPLRQNFISSIRTLNALMEQTMRRRRKCNCTAVCYTLYVLQFRTPYGGLSSELAAHGCIGFLQFAGRTSSSEDKVRPLAMCY